MNCCFNFNESKKFNTSIVICKPEMIQDVGLLETFFKLINEQLNCLTLSNIFFSKFPQEFWLDFYKSSLISKKDILYEYSDYLADKVVLVMIFLWDESVLNIYEKLIELFGCTDPLKADKNSFRGKYGLSISRNLVHYSKNILEGSRDMYCISNILFTVDFFQNSSLLDKFNKISIKNIFAVESGYTLSQIGYWKFVGKRFDNYLDCSTKYLKDYKDCTK